MNYKKTDQNFRPELTKRSNCFTSAPCECDLCQGDFAK